MRKRLTPTSQRKWRSRQCERNEQGFFTIWVLGLCVMVLGIGGLSYDLWHSFSDKRELSSIVDGAAVAAASQIDLATFRADSTIVKIDPVLARRAADDYLTQAQAESGLVLTDVAITFPADSVVITASTATALTLTKLFVPTGDLTSTVSGIANPRQAA